MSDRNTNGEWVGHVHDKRCYPFRSYGMQTVDCYAQHQWAKKMTALLAKEPKSMRGFSFMPKGEVT